ncbi:MAG TPA: metabolite traffic protein EboE [Chitinophaga sp.]|uniref:metabolite traffic protein EboE n=1 Tax=Chitinophaga sp. TaxID=1869181 RepID=UPI002F9277F7
MQTPYGHLTYCTNIHPGENWDAHFKQLQLHIPLVKAALGPDQPFGIGLRLSNKASLELSKEAALQEFKDWLQQQGCYVFTMNGFPYGGFHNVTVKDQVHVPDWTTGDRVTYTIRLFRLLAALLPEGMEGGVSTCPLSYKLWNRCAEEKASVTESATLNLLLVVEQLARIRRSGGPLLHIDIEPEPDGMLENSQEYIDWYFQQLMPAGIPFLSDKLGVTEDAAAQMLKDHVQLCYDVCHFALAYEQPEAVLNIMRQYGLKIGKLQISAALKALLPAAGSQERANVIDAFRTFNEPTYLHQVIARTGNGYTHYPDLPEALADAENPQVQEWRSHFHVPLFIDHYGLLSATREDIQQVLALQQTQLFTTHLEVETYTWEVLPPDLKLPMDQSIARELAWVQQQLEL